MKVKCKFTKLVPISELKPHPRNRNSHPAEQIERIKKILVYQGWRKPVVVSNQSGFMTAGHGRIEAAKELGWDQVPVDYQDYDNDDQEYSDLVADNALSAWSSLDFAGINSDVPELGPDLDIDMLGIRNFEIDVAEKDLDYEKEWQGMPEFDQKDKTAFKTVALHFHDQEAVEKFAKLIDQPITDKTRTIWYPNMIIEKASDKRYDA